MWGFIAYYQADGLATRTMVVKYSSISINHLFPYGPLFRLFFSDKCSLRHSLASEWIGDLLQFVILDMDPLHDEKDS